MNEKELNKYSIKGISIQQDSNSSSYFIILVYDSQEVADFMYKVLSTSNFKLEVKLDYKTKIYDLALVLKYNLEKDIVYAYCTEETSDDYPPLQFLNNASVKFLTTGVQKNNDAHYYYHKPLLHLETIFHPN